MTEFLQSIDEMPFPADIDPSALERFAVKATGGDRDKLDTHAVLTQKVHSGAVDDYTRFDAFNTAVGYFIKIVRTGAITLDDAKAMSKNWMQAQMVPPRSDAWFEKEFGALVEVDKRNHGPTTASGPNVQSRPDSYKPIIEWRADIWADTEPPPLRPIVPGLIMAEMPHVLCAGGGIGKTYLMLDLILKMATKQPGDGQTWLGIPLDDEHGSGAAALLTMEDSADDIHRRIHKLRPKREGLGQAYIVPYVSNGGSFRLLERERGSRTAIPTAGWRRAQDELRQIPNLKLVVVDTLNSTIHDEENSNTVSNEYLQALIPFVCGELRSALVLTHHPRKSNKTIFHTPRDYLEEVRGGGALTAGFRATLGIWETPDYEKRMVRMGLEPRRNHLFSYGVCKHNPEGFLSPDETRYALRGPKGLLEDLTQSVRSAAATIEDIRKAWLVKVIEVGAATFQPFTRTGDKSGFHRRAQLPVALQDMKRTEYEKLIGELLADGTIMAGSDKYMDVPGGCLARNEGPTGGGYQRQDGIWYHPEWEKEFAYDPINDAVVAYENLNPMNNRDIPGNLETGGNDGNE